MRIGVVGTGIAGLSAAWLMAQDHQVDVFEKVNPNLYI
jgi:predicted NAD/FAD-binding protein